MKATQTTSISDRRARTLDGAPTIRFQRPELPALSLIAPYYRLAEEARWYSNGGPCSTLLVQRTQARLGRGILTLPVSSCTSGLVVALSAVTDGDDPDRTFVITPTYTFAAAPSAILGTGHVPLLVDVDPETWQPSVAAIEQALDIYRGKVAAVLCTSTFGTPAPVAVLRHWEELCAREGVPLVVDSAAGFGARNGDGVEIGHQGDVEVFSFHATKPFAVGEGGLVATKHPHLYERMLSSVNFGFDENRIVRRRYGTNAKMSEITAATALAVLDTYDAVLQTRRAKAEIITGSLKPFYFTVQVGSSGSTWQTVPLQAPNVRTRTQTLERAAQQRVELRAYYDVPIHRFPVFADLPRVGQLSTADRLAQCALSLPMANDLTDDEARRIVRVVAG